MGLGGLWQTVKPHVTDAGTNIAEVVEKLHAADGTDTLNVYIADAFYMWTPREERIRLIKEIKAYVDSRGGRLLVRARCPACAHERRNACSKQSARSTHGSMHACSMHAACRLAPCSR